MLNDGGSSFLRAEHARVEARDAEAAAMTLSGFTQDHREGVKAFIENRDPEFTGD